MKPRNYYPEGMAGTPKQYGLIESIGQGRTDIDGDADAEYYEECIASRRVQPVGHWGEPKMIGRDKIT